MIPVLNKRTDALPDGHVYVGRPSPWGNPYPLSEGTRIEVVRRYRLHIKRNPLLIQQLADLKPVALVCWCAPLPCHADVLAELLEPVL